jgi:putative methyltransferase (TIGR04325 family)
MHTADTERLAKSAKGGISGVMRSIVRRVLPRRVVAAIRLLLRSPRSTYSAPYKTWEAARHAAFGYHDPAILEKIRKSALAVKESGAAFERDSMAYQELVFRWPLLACLLHVALHKNASSGRPLHILDFGGSLGSVYFQHRVFLDRLPSLLWSIVEQPHFVQCGNAEFSDERLRYFNAIADATARAPIDCALFSGSLGYVEMPYDLLAQIAALGSTYLILDLVQTCNETEDLIKVQHTRPPFYVAKLAVRFFAKKKLVAYLDSIGYDVIAALPAGFFCERK